MKRLVAGLMVFGLTLGAAAPAWAFCEAGHPCWAVNTFVRAKNLRWINGKRVADLRHDELWFGYNSFFRRDIVQSLGWQTNPDGSVRPDPNWHALSTTGVYLSRIQYALSSELVYAGDAECASRASQGLSCYNVAMSVVASDTLVSARSPQEGVLPPTSYAAPLQPAPLHFTRLVTTGVVGYNWVHWKGWEDNHTWFCGHVYKNLRGKAVLKNPAGTARTLRFEMGKIHVKSYHHNTLPGGTEWGHDLGQNVVYELP